MRILLLFVVIVATSILVSISTLYVLNNNIEQPQYHNDTLFIKDIMNGNNKTVVIRTTSLRVDSTGKVTGSQKVEYSNVKSNIHQELINLVKNSSHLNKSAKKSIKYYLKLGMEEIKEELLKQGFTEDVASVYIGKWNSMFDLILNLADLDDKDQAQLIKQMNENLPLIESKKDFDLLKSLSVNAVLHGEQTAFMDNFLTFAFIVSIGNWLSNNK